MSQIMNVHSITTYSSSKLERAQISFNSRLYKLISVSPNNKILYSNEKKQRIITKKNADDFHKDNIFKKESTKKEYIQYSIIHMKFKNRLNSLWKLG